MRVTLCLLGVLLAVAATGATGKEADLRALLVTGGHAYDQPAFDEMLGALDGVRFTQLAHPDPKVMDLLRPARADEYDAAVLYDSWQEITDEQRAALLELVRSGKGFVVLHHAMCTYDRWPEWHKLVGGHYYLAPATVDGEVRPASTFHEGVDISVAIADPGHPITKGLGPFTVRDEVYGSYWVSPEAHVLLTTDHPESTPSIAWTSEYGEGRVVCLQLGHGPGVFANATYRELLRRSVLWVAGRLE
jgi:hypothetical protein